MIKEKDKNYLKNECGTILSKKDKNNFLIMFSFFVILTLVLGVFFYFTQHEKVKQMSDDATYFLLATIVQGMSALWGLLFLAHFFFLERTMSIIGKLKLGVGFITVLSFFNFWIISSIVLGLWNFLIFKNTTLITMSLFFCLMAIFGIVVLTIMVLFLIYLIPVYKKTIKRE